MIRLSNKKTVFLILSIILSGIVLIYIYENPTKKSDYNCYEQREEARIIAMIETLEGVSDVSVLLTFENDVSVNLSINNDGSSVISEIKGIAVSAVGADDPLISEKIISMLCAAYNINSRTVFVCGK